MWPLYALMGASTVMNIMGQSSAANAQAEQLSKQSNAENEAIAKHNMSQIVRNSYRAGILNMQLGLQKKQAAQQGHKLTAQHLAVRGLAESNIAASGTVGASAEAVLSDIDMKLGEAQAQQRDNNEMMLVNYNNDLEVLKMNALNEVVQPRKYEYNGPSAAEIAGSGVMNLAMQLGGQYAMSQMNLGLGPKTPGTGVNYLGVQAAKTPLGFDANTLGSGLRL